MSTTVERPGTPRLDRSPPRRALELRWWIGGATLAAAAAMVVVVGHDGAAPLRLVRVAVVLAVVVGAVQLHRRLGERGGGVVALALSMVAVAAGVGFLPFVVKGHWGLRAGAAVVLVAAGLVLLVVGIVATSRGRGVWSGAVRAAGAVAATAVACWVVSPAVMVTNVPRPSVDADPSRRGLAVEAVDLVTSDGVHLAAWYLPSRNGAAVVLRHGAGSTRAGVLDQAAVLFEHGFGVLMADAQGHGRSGGRAMDFGWQGDGEVRAATRFLAARPEVDPGRIGAVGLSMGGEEVIGASATDPRIRAVVAEGATARTAADDAWLSERYGIRGAVQEWLEQARDVVTDLLTEASVPVALRDAVASSGDVRYLLIAAGELPDEVHAARHLRRADPERVAVWVVPGAGHTGGLHTEPHHWEERVVGFLTETLLQPARPGAGG